MAKAYQRFLSTGIDLAPLGVERRADDRPYFCTPRGARIIGWAGVDGIHFCFVRGHGEMVFSVSPMNGAPDYVHPLAADFTDFLRLLLACGDAAALEQAWQWDEAQFEDFLRDNPPTEAQRAVMAALESRLALTPMEDPWQYITDLQEALEADGLSFPTEFHHSSEQSKKQPSTSWKVTLEGGFWSREGRGGTEIPVGTEFTWAGYRWLVPAIYSCGKGLVVDLCYRVAPKELTAFAEKWGLTPENEHTLRFTREEEQQIEAENPLTFDFNAHIYLNGKLHHARHGWGQCYNPVFPEVQQDAEKLVEHYGLDPNWIWVFRRMAFPWQSVRKPSLRSLALELEQQPVPVPGGRFTVHAPGDTVSFTRPATGMVHTLTVQELFPQEHHFPRPSPIGASVPTHSHILGYTLTPDLPQSILTISDVLPNDELRWTPDASAPAGTFFGIIGGSDGPTALILSTPQSCSALHTTCSALHFEPVEQVTWQATFHETSFEPIMVSLL